MSSPAAVYNPQVINPPASLQNDLFVSGKKFVTFVGKNVLNLTGIAIGTALLVNQWYVSGITLLALGSYNIFSNAAASQTWIPRCVRQFIIEKGGFIVSGATAIALIATQSHILGISLLIYASYRLVDNLGLIPRGISVVMERFFPWRTLPSCAFVDTTPIGIFNFFSLFIYIPPIERFIYEKTDLLMHKFFELDGPTLEEIIDPYNPRPSLSFEKIKEILNGKDSDYTLNVSHCSRKVTDVIPVDGQDRHFEKLLAMSKSTSWSSSSKEIFATKSFQTFLSEEFPDIDTQELKNHPEVYAGKLASVEGLTGSEYADLWLKKRFENVVNVLNGRIAYRVKGSQNELDDAIKDVAKILPYLEKINKHTDPVRQKEAQSILYRLALKTSSCQSSDIRTIAARTLLDVSKKHFDDTAAAAPTPQNLAKRYEFNVLKAMQDARLTAIQLIAKKTEDDLTKMKDILLPPSNAELEKAAAKLPKVTQKQEDDTLLSLHRDYINFGFLPLDTYDRENVNLPLLYVAKICNHIFNYITENPSPNSSLYDTYRMQIDSDIIDCSKDEFWSYIQYILDSNHLSLDAQEEIKKLYNAQNRADKTTQKNFQRLLLVSLGILRKAA